MALVLSDTPAVKVWRARPEHAASAAFAGRLLIAVALLGGVIAAGFAWMGAWMVFPFTGLELLGLWWALRHVARAAKDFEEIRLQADCLQVTSNIAGRTTRHEFHPYWAQVDLISATPKSRLVIRSHGREIEIGRLLGEAQKSLLARDLKARLEAFRTSPPGNPAQTHSLDSGNEEDS